jgi:hypothetical protein
MSRSLPIALLFLGVPTVPAAAQENDWRPPGRSMPTMPELAELSAPGWMSSRAEWFRGLERSAGVGAAALRPVGEPRTGGTARVVRYLAGPLPVVVWSDRDEDGDADLIEIYRSGSVVVHLVDPDYDGIADVLRRYDLSGRLISEERL